MAPLCHPQGARADGAPARPSPSDSFTDVDGREQPFSRTYERYIGSGRGEPDHARAAVEAAGFLAIGTVLYVAKPGANSLDWEFASFWSKFSPNAIRFDNNKFTTNNILHPLAGGGIYGFARLNHLTIPAAYGYALASSALWELAFEWREKASINDLIMTSVGGMVFGECFVHLVEYLDSGPPGGPWGRQAARYTLGLPGALHDWLDHKTPGGGGLPADELGLSSAYWHRFHVGYELAYAVDEQHYDGFMQSAVVESEIVTIPGFLRPGRFQLFFTRGDFTEMRLRMGFSSGDGLADVDLWFRAALLGYYKQEVTRAPFPGYAWALSLVSAFTNQQWWLLGHRDEVGILHALGPSIETWLTTHDFWLHARLEGSFDFAALRPEAFASWREHNPQGTIKAILSERADDFDFGASGRALLALTYRGIELGSRFFYGYYHSVGGLDRYQEAITRATPSSDQMIAFRSWLGCRVPSLPVEVRLGLETRLRLGRMESVYEQHWERLATAETALVF